MSIRLTRAGRARPRGGGWELALWYGIRLTGLEDSPIENIVFENMTIASTKGVKLTHVKNITFRNVTVTPKTGPVFEATNAQEVRVDGRPLEMGPAR